MKSNADIIYNHIEKQKGDFIVPIEINTDDFLADTLMMYLCKKNIFDKIIKKEEAERKARCNSIILAPYFAFESEKWAKNIGVKIDFWSEQEHEKFKDFFMNKYKSMLK